MRRRFAKARTRRQAGCMNGLERAYADILNERMKAGEVREWLYERVKLVIASPPTAKPCTYCPDFMVILADGTMEFHETKGFMMDDARVKLKCAAEQFPFAFKVVTRASKKNGGGWATEEF